MVENNCMDRYEESGSCLANDSQALNTEEREQLISDYFAGKANAPGGGVLIITMSNMRADFPSQLAGLLVANSNSSNFCTLPLSNQL